MLWFFRRKNIFLGFGERCVVMTNDEWISSLSDRELLEYILRRIALLDVPTSHIDMQYCRIAPDNREKKD